LNSGSQMATSSKACSLNSGSQMATSSKACEYL